MYLYELYIDDSKRRVICLGVSKFLDIPKVISKTRELDSSCAFFIDDTTSICLSRRINGIFDNRSAHISFYFVEEL